jgi:hypothetical protein
MRGRGPHYVEKFAGSALVWGHCSSSSNSEWLLVASDVFDATRGSKTPERPLWSKLVKIRGLPRRCHSSPQKIATACLALLA